MHEPSERLFSQTVEDYVKSIYLLQQDSGSAATSELAKKMKTSPAASTKMIKHLTENRLTEHTKYHGVRLSPAGEKIALEIIRHHRLIELYLHQALGYEWDEVDAEAEKLEHHISEEFEARIDKMLDYPLTDPHGDPIPTREGAIAPRRGAPLDNSEPGETLVILRVRDNPEALRYLRQLEMKLGTVLEVTEKQPFNGPITLKIGDKTHSIGRELASHVFVERHKTDSVD